MQKPTEKELEILDILWQLQKATVREIHDELSKVKQVGYTTVLKFMQILTEKGMVVPQKNPHQKQYSYQAVYSRSDVQENYISNIIKNLFQGSASNLVLNAIGNSQINEAELEKIKEFIKNLEHKTD
ncbi:MAG: BlaI/MecI/CopY family transcriptional regulator [Sediminibacterium sp.]|nr:BlaI/MecI/CopY family transcriptional regulator [Sediminibacterium sp.]